MNELEEWVEKELKSKDMKKFNRKKQHKEYLEKRIIELRKALFGSLFIESNKEVDERVELCRELFNKYNEKLRKLK